ncbi:unnamed protein product [Symbiodinium necroappetens]|uniref:Uncharacterized protein n=1 Tax=Symbiodinium necroappetens TaxID=1628268 RepID=A0A813CKT8_9DINO|nr:unnamed protein product [Symbiodinium necroappetens]
MESWKARFRQAIVKDGPLKGARYLDVPEPRLAKVARSYKHDDRFRQFARMATEAQAGDKASSNSEGEVPAVARVARRPALGWRMRCYKVLLWLKSLRQALRWCLVVSFLVLLCRPFALRFAARLIGGILRLVVRRLLSLTVLVLDQVFEELILQLAVVVEPASPFLADGQCPSYPTLGVLHQLVLSSGGALAGALIHYVAQKLRTRPVLRL